MPSNRNQNPKTLAARWALYEKAVVPDRAGEGQRKDLKHAFYAGFLECFDIFGDSAGENLDDRAMQAMISTLSSEGVAFVDECRSEAAGQEAAKARKAMRQGGKPQ